MSFQIDLEGGIGSDQVVDGVGGEAPEGVGGLGGHRNLSLGSEVG